MKKLMGLAVAALLFAACHSKQLPEGVLNEERMADFLAEAYLLESYYSVKTHFAYDTLPPELEGAYDALLGRLGISQAQVDSSFNYYAAHTDDYAAVQERVSTRLEELESRQTEVALPPPEL